MLTIVNVKILLSVLVCFPTEHDLNYWTITLTMVILFLYDVQSSTSSLFMPEPEDAVAHGDATLAVNDFLTRTPL